MSSPDTPKRSNLKWLNKSLATMYMSMDIAYCCNSPYRGYVIDYVGQIGAEFFTLLGDKFYFIDKIRTDCAYIYEKIYGKIVLVPWCEPKQIWNEIISYNDDMRRVVENMDPDKIKFDKNPLYDLLRINDFVRLLPNGHGYLLYCVGEIFNNSERYDLLHEWHQNLERNQKQFLNIMVADKIKRSDLQIDIPLVLIDIIITYTIVELNPRKDVMAYLLTI